MKDAAMRATDEVKGLKFVTSGWRKHFNPLCWFPAEDLQELWSWMCDCILFSFCEFGRCKIPYSRSIWMHIRMNNIVSNMLASCLLINE